MTKQAWLVKGKPSGRASVRILIIIMLLLAAPSEQAFAADPAANFVVKLFTDVCIPNIGQPTKVRTWAEEHHLAAITSPAALGIFVGTGNNGSAWAIPAASGSFALSIRGTSEACAVWARTADPAEVRTDFQKIMEGIKRPGIDVSIYQDVKSASPVGEAHSLVYSVGGSGQPNGLLFTMLTAEHPGGAFQASLQAAVSKKP